MNTTNWATIVGSIIVALIAGWAAIAAQRAAANATRVSAKATENNARLDAEKEAYARARSLDTQTIEDLRNENSRLKVRVRDLEVESDANREELRILRRKIYHIEHDVKEE